MTAQGGLAGVGGAVSLAPGRQPGHRRVSTGTAAVRVLRAGAAGDWQDPVTSRARQREQAEALVRGHRGVGRVGPGAKHARK
jgi:hypothetical protein